MSSGAKILEGVNVLESIGRGTSISSNIDNLTAVSGNGLANLSLGAQAAASVAGYYAVANPVAAITLGTASLSVQLAKFSNDVNNNAGIATYLSDINAVIGATAVIGAGGSALAANPEASVFFSALSIASDVASVGLNHPENVRDAAQNAINSIAQSGSSTLNYVGNILNEAKDDLNDAIDGYITTGIADTLKQIINENLPSVFSNTGIDIIQGGLTPDNNNTEIKWIDKNGNIGEALDGDTIHLDPIDVQSETIDIGKNTSATISGNNNQIDTAPSSYVSLQLYGQGNTVAGDNGNNGINLAGDGSSATISGTNGIGGYVGLVGNNESLNLPNWGSTVLTASGVTGENISGSYSSITLGGNATANISGTGDTLGFGGSNGFAGIQGTGENINNNDASNLVNINGDGSSATVNGDVSIGLYGSNQSVSLDNSGDQLTVYGGFTGEGINATGDTVALGGNASANVFGSRDTIQLQSNSNAYAGVFGQNQTVTGDSGSSNVNLGGDGTSATVSGGGYVGLCGNNQSITFTDGGSSLLTVPDAKNESISANSSTITINTDSSANIFGSGDSIHLQGNSNDYAGVFGQNQIVTGDSGNNSINLGGDGTSATVSGGGYVGLCGNDETLNLDGGNFSVATASGVREETINGSGETITLPSDVHVTINGSGDTIYGLQGNDDVTINGAYNTFDGNSDEVDFEGNISSDRAGGDNDSYFDDGSYAGGTDGGGGYGYDPGDGDGDDWDDFDPLVLNLRGQAVQTVGIDHSKAAFDIHGTGTQVKVGWGTPGEGYLVDLPAGKSAVTQDSDLVGSFAALRALDSNHDGRIDAHDAAWSNLKVWVDPTGHADPTQGSLVSLDQLGIASIDIDATPDRHSDNGNVILNDSTFTRKDGTAGAISGVAFRAASDGVHPVSPLTILPPAAIAAAPPSLAAQASQLAAAMAAFGGASGSDTGLHTVPTAVQGTLTADPSQTGHATQPLRHAA
ncbi:beta strand repeat-containing protein [Methylobacterium aquaticum]|uniref:beta strand repeat-containing protein n=1 Tax=Methylobacterium aquaticum TaxID=270351 RepID=UPI003D17DC01